MDILEHFRGTYQQSHADLLADRGALIEQIRGFVPDNVLPILEAGKDDEAELELDWVKVPDPRSNDPTPVLEVLPVIRLWWGEWATGSSQPPIPGLAGMTLLGKLPDGHSAVIGSIDALNGSHEPLLTLNKSARDPSETHGCEWECADATLFLAVVQFALDAQPVNTEDL